MRLQHYNAATRGGTGNRGTADVQAPYERKRRRNPWLGLDGLFRSGSHLLVFAGSEIGPLLGVKNLVLCLQNARGVLDATGAPLAYRPQGKDSLDVERVQLVGVRQGLEQLVQALRQPPGIRQRIEQLKALSLLFAIQHQFAFFYQLTCCAPP